tara:strand:+ start:487 stop:1059 length:573 start_codon:yes stop_codon:yes gene_type:complete
MQRTTGKSGFKMRSGNRPTFAKMGSSPANMRTFGIGQGTSPYKEVDYVKMQKESAKIDPRYADMTLEEYEAEVKRQQKSYKETGDYDAKNAFKNNTEKTNVDKKNEELDPNDIETKEDIDKEQKSGSKVGNILKGIAKVGAAALTGGLDAVYGTGKVVVGPGGGTRFTTKNVDDGKDKKDKKFGETALDE